jgi:O-antigen/teichoic acid export membrane protein
VLTPLVSAQEARGQLSGVRHSLVTGARLTTMLVLPIAVTFILRGSTFIGLWMGPDYAGPSGRVLGVLAVFMTCHAGYQVLTATMIGIGRHRGLIVVFIADAAANVILSVLLVPRFGIVGSALGTLIPQLVVTLIVAPWYARRELKIPFREFWVNVYLRPALAIVPFAIVSEAIERSWGAPHLALYFVQVLLALPFAAVGAWLVALRSEERQLIVRWMMRNRMVTDPNSGSVVP